MSDHELDALMNSRPVLFGLRAQGHIPTVEAMLRDGCTWTEIGRAIGWDGMTAKRFYEIDRAAVAAGSGAEAADL